MKTVLLVEDDEATRDAASRELAAAGFNVLAAEGSMQALALADQQRPDVLVTGLRLLEKREPHGWALASMLKTKFAELRVVFVIEFSEETDPVEEDLGLVVSKPLKGHELVATIQRALR